ncbi:glycosyltransferase family 4 protein [Halosimplex amylolyticum]|uniref:glycosyltransferase family 4 protein n=1 Tax=Halosimplex amylolyticum TaxID=3396616 RepID=UPI003F543999
MSDPLRVKFFTLTPGGGSEHIYLAELRDALTDQNVVPVDDWFEADVVHLFEVNALTGETIRAFEFPTLLRILRSDTPLVISTDDLYFSDDPDLTVRPRLYPINHRLQRQLFKRADAIVALSESVKSRLAPHVDMTPIHVVHHGVRDAYRSKYTQTDDPFALHVSLAAPRKNPDAVVEVAKRLDHELVVAGSGWDERIPDGVSNVTTPGFVPERDLIDLYHRAAVFYFPTRHEGFGLPVLEAMAASTAVVASNVYSVPEVAGDAAVLHDPHDVDAHVDSIERLLSHQDERRALATDAYGRASGFTWEKSAAETKAVYRSVLDER